MGSTHNADQQPQAEGRTEPTDVRGPRYSSRLLVPESLIPTEGRRACISIIQEYLQTFVETTAPGQSVSWGGGQATSTLKDVPYPYFMLVMQGGHVYGGDTLEGLLEWVWNHAFDWGSMPAIDWNTLPGPDWRK